MPRKVLGKRALRELDPNATAVGTGNPPAKKKAVPSALLGLEDPVGSSAEESALCPATINPEDMAGSACSVGGKGRKKKAPAAPAKDEQMIPSHVPLPATEPKSNPSDNSHIHVADVPAPAAAASGLRGPSRPRRARFRVPRGPVPAYPVDRKTEQGKPGVFLPRVVPEEWLTTLGEIGNLIPQSLCRGVDGTPNRELTLRNEVWWATHGEWVKSHKAKLGLTPDLIAKYRTEAAALADAPPKEKQSEGKGPRNGKKRSARRDGEPYLIMGPFGPVLGELDPSHLGTGDNDFVCIPRPHWDLCDDPEYSSDDDLDDSDGSDSERRPSKEQLARRAKRIEIGKKAGFYIEKQLAYLHPEYKWTMTLLGWERYLWWTQESAKRDQDVTGCYFYNDYSWYGDVEVVENIILTYDMVYNMNPTNVMAIWHELEAAALFLADLKSIGHIDDGERASELIELIGYMAVSACELIVVVESLSNAPLILGLLIYFSHIWHKAFHDPAADWRLRLLEIAQARHIDLTACRVPMCLPEFVKEMKEERRPVDPKWRRVDWPSMLWEYSSVYTMGGTDYDITRDDEGYRSHKFYY